MYTSIFYPQAPFCDRVLEFERRFHLKDLDEPSHQPSMHLAKAYQDGEYALANKVLHMHTDIRPTHIHTQI